MKLFWSSRSPYVRKVMVVAELCNLADRLELVEVAVGAAILSDAVMAHNPLNKIPALVLDDGSALFDSRVICEFFDAYERMPLLFPQDINERIQALRWQSLGDGIMDNATLTMGENRRAGAAHSAKHVSGYRYKTRLALDLLEREADRLAAAELNIGSVAIAVALSHLDFRFDAENWRAGRSNLARWFASISDMDAMHRTAFKDA